MTEKIELLLKELENNIAFYKKQVPTISKSNIGWHIEHSLLTLDRIIEQLSRSNSAEYKWKLNFPKLFVFTTKTIPRGRAESPQSVRPKEEITTDSLTKHLTLTKDKLKELAFIKPRQYFVHPYFGHLKLKQAIKFLEIHTRHHLKIITDIKS